jgi:hypothetical protein
VQASKKKKGGEEEQEGEQEAKKESPGSGVKVIVLRFCECYLIPSCAV